MSIVKKVLGSIYHPIIHIFRRERLLLRNYESHKISITNSENTHNTNSKVGIQFHIFYTDLLDEIYSHLKYITIPYDLYVSTNTTEKKKEIEIFFIKNALKAENICVEVVENVGRDVYPFHKQLSSHYREYDFIAHFHTKKSTTVTIGNRWRKSLYSSLLGKKNHFDREFFYLQNNKNIGLLLPWLPNIRIVRQGYYCDRLNDWNQNAVKDLLTKFNAVKEDFSLVNYEFPVGTMFIARTDAIKQFFEHKFTKDDFPPEQGQLQFTLHHSIEFIWHPLCEFNGYEYATIK